MTTDEGVRAPARALHPYVPRLALDWLAEHPDQHHLAVDGSLAFVDISGFTQLTERLARVGRAGSEELSDLLDATFGALLDVARDDGADLVKWGGDAVLLLFRGDDHAAHAARAAARMRQALREVGRARASVGEVRLRMSVGVHSGRFHFYLVGDPDIHRELIVSGPAASVTAQMEAVAGAGQIVVSDTLAAQLPPACLGAVVDGGRILRTAPRIGDLPPTPDERHAAVDAGALLPPPVRSHLLDAAGQSEHRAVAVAFVEFSGTDALIGADPAGAVDALDACVRNVQEACLEHGVTFLESDINRDGGKFMLVSGAPRSAGGDDDRLLQAVQAIVERQGALTLRAGVNHGRVFAGDFGPPFRRTYSLKGDANNTAARVMARAEPGTALVTSEVTARAHTRFATRPVPPFLVKGKRNPIEAVVLGAPQDDVGIAALADDDTFVGRVAELRALQDGLARVRSATGSMIEVIGEPGMGKSRLIQELLRDAGDLLVVSGPSGSYEAKTPYYPFRTLLRGLLGISRVDDVARTAERLAERAHSGAPHLVPWLPLLGLVLGVEFPPTRETDELDERFRRTRLEEVVVELLEVALPTPALLVFENTHLMDDASRDLLARIEHGLDDRPWLVVVTRRDVETGYRPTGAGGRLVSLPLTPIGGDDALSLLDATSRAAPLSAHTMAAIAQKAGGNPLFLKALVAAASRASRDDELPDSVEAVLTSEVDRLPPDARTLLRYAAVLGVRFSEQMLRGVLEASDSTVADADLARLGGLIEPDGEGLWRFRHALIRDVAYAGLPYRLRRLLHEHAGRVLAATAANVEEVSERLSLHFFHARDYRRAWTYSRLAGDRAKGQYAYTAAIAFFERALESAQASGAAREERAEMADVWEALGDVRDVAGDSRDAVTSYRRARPFRRDDPLGQAALLLKEAGIQQRLGAVVTSFRLLTYARRLLRDVEGPAAEAARSRLATRYGFGKYLRGDYRGALRWSEIGVREARVSADPDALAYAYNTRHIACIHAGVAEDEPYGELALDAYARLGDLRMQAHCLNNLAIGAMQDGQWDRSAELLDRAADTFRRVGDSANEANTLYNRADLLIRQRRFAEAEPLLVVAERAARAADDLELVALATRELARARSGLGRHDDALDLFEQARSTFADLSLVQEAIGVDAGVAECMLDAGRLEQAVQVATETIARAEAEQVESALAGLHRVRAASLRALGRDDEARAAYQAGLQVPDSGDGRREYALIRWGIARLIEPDDPQEAMRLQSDSEAILAALGVRTEPSW